VVPRHYRAVSRGAGRTPRAHPPRPCHIRVDGRNRERLVGWPRGRARGRRRRFGCSLAPASDPPGTDGRSIHRCSSICWSELVQLAVHAQADGCAEASVSVVSQARSAACSDPSHAPVRATCCYTLAHSCYHHLLLHACYRARRTGRDPAQACWFHTDTRTTFSIGYC